MAFFFQTSLSSAQQEEQVRASLLKRLLQKASEAGLILMHNVPYDGDCFFHSVVSLSPRCDNAASLRSTLVDFFLSDQCPGEVKDYMQPGFLSDLSVAHKDVDNDLVVKGLVEMLQQPIRVFSFDPDNGNVSDDTFRPLTGQKAAVPLVIGHIKEKHFVPLKTQEETSKKRPKTQSLLDRFAVKKPKVTTGSCLPAGPCTTHTPVPLAEQADQTATTTTDEPGKTSVLLLIYLCLLSDEQME